MQDQDINMSLNNKIELLAPAGNFQCLVAAVQCGADAVYISGKSFGARSFADNFDEAELEKAVDYCHIRGVKVYVTVNTLILDKELSELSNYLKFLNKIGADAIIVQDLAVLEIAKNIVPKLPVHASTQMTIHNSDGVRTLEKSGVKRFVLARELSLENIKKIADTTNAELEIFGHGALCMSYSGQCLMSSIIGGRSGNRGKCAQPCRLEYTVNNNPKKAYYMSLKDLCSLNHLDEMRKIGVASLKIEGRMKGPAYVGAVVSIYRKYIDNPDKISQDDIDVLDSVFNRGGLTDGYLTNKKGCEMFAFDKPDNPYLKSAKVYTDNLLNKIKKENKKLFLNCKIDIKKNNYPRIEISCGAFKIEYIGDVLAEQALKNSLTIESIMQQILKTGGTPFEFSDVLIDVEDDLFLSSGSLNMLRRNALKLFEDEYIKTFKRPDTNVTEEIICQSEPVNTNPEYVCEVSTFSQFECLKKYLFKYFYIPLHLINENKKSLINYKEKIVIVPPSIIHEDEKEFIFKNIEELLKDGFLGVLANNISLIERFKNYNVFGGLRLNIFNSVSLKFFKEQGLKTAELSPELNINQISSLKRTIPVQVMAYGRLPLMLTESCIIKNGGGCPCNDVNFITDRMGMRFPVIKDGNSCRNIVLNCKKTYFPFDTKQNNLNIDLFRLYFTDESNEECINITQSIFDKSYNKPQDFTSGHFNKGVL
jgi:putative protease